MKHMVYKLYGDSRKMERQFNRDLRWAEHHRIKVYLKYVNKILVEKYVNVII